LHVILKDKNKYHTTEYIWNHNVEHKRE
jgi:hypothetical protein